MMKKLIAFALVTASVLPAYSRVRNVVNCADELVSVRIDTSGEFGSSQYQVTIKDLRNGETSSYRTVRKDHPAPAPYASSSFASVTKGNSTINVDSVSIAFVKEGWGLVVIGDENCNINLN